MKRGMREGTSFTQRHICAIPHFATYRSGAAKREGGGVQTGGLPDLHSSFLFCAFFCPFASLFVLFSRFVRDFPDFPDLSCSSFSPVNSTHEEQS